MRHLDHDQSIESMHAVGRTQVGQLERGLLPRRFVTVLLTGNQHLQFVLARLSRVSATGKEQSAYLAPVTRDPDGSQIHLGARGSQLPQIVGELTIGGEPGAVVALERGRP